MPSDLTLYERLKELPSQPQKLLKCSFLALPIFSHNLLRVVVVVTPSGHYVGSPPLSFLGNDPYENLGCSHLWSPGPDKWY